ncbi:TPA: CPBP family intramembrane glutamic endopeptidase [Elizabethkingia anophelis]
MEISKTRKKSQIFGKVLLFYLLSILIFATVAGITKNLIYPDYVSIFITAFLTYFLVLAFIRWDKLSAEDVGIKYGKFSLSRFFCGLGIGSLMVILQAIIVSVFADVKFSLSDNISILSIFSSILLYFFVALREELVFRSYALWRLTSITKPPVALLVITVIFILEHVVTGTSWKISIIGSGLGGLLFGIAALKTKGLALPLGLHFSWNFTQWLLGFKNNTGIWKEIVVKSTQAYAENIALTAFIIVMSISICGVLIYYKHGTKTNL